MLDQDRSGASHDLLAKLDGSRFFERVADLRNIADIRVYIDEQRALLVLQIPQDFERRLMSGLPGNVQVIADGRNSNTAGTALAYVGAHAGLAPVRHADRGRIPERQPLVRHRHPRPGHLLAGRLRGAHGARRIRYVRSRYR